MRIGGGGGWGAITGNTYQVKTEAVTPASASGLTAKEIEALFAGLDPAAVAEAGRAHMAMAKGLQSCADSLVTHARVLAGAWSGVAAQAAITKLQQRYETTVELARASAQTGQVLTWLGETILPYYKNWKAPGNGIVGKVESLLGSNPQDHDAQKVLERLNDRLSQANAGLPASISFNPARLGQSNRAPVASGGAGSARGVGVAVASAGPAGSPGGVTSPADGGVGGVTGVSSGGSGASGQLGTTTTPAAPIGPGGHAGQPPSLGDPPTHLAGPIPGGGTPPGTGGLPGQGGLPGGGLPGGGPPGGGLPGGPGPVGPVPVPGQPPGAGGGGAPGDGPPQPGTGLGGGVPGSPGLASEAVAFPSGESAVMGSNGMLIAGPGMDEGGVGSGGAGTTGFIGAGDAAGRPGGLPMAGGSGSSRRENDRYRQAWMTEDLDTWQGDGPGE